jgi:hypothetical protein
VCVRGCLGSEREREKRREEDGKREIGCVRQGDRGWRGKFRCLKEFARAFRNSLLIEL